MKSIMQKPDGTCYLCIRLNGDYSEKQTQEHHCICGTANRKLSEKYGLKVRLCLPHHLDGRAAVHNNHEIMQMLQQDAQRAFEDRFPELSFREIFGKNFLDDSDRQKAAKPHKDKIEDGFRPL